MYLFKLLNVFVTMATVRDCAVLPARALDSKSSLVRRSNYPIQCRGAQASNLKTELELKRKKIELFPSEAQKTSCEGFRNTLLDVQR